MSDNEATSAGKGQKAMSESDISFFGTCLEHTTAGPVIVDVPAAAAALGYKNPRSVTNRITELKKKYNLPLGTVGSHRKKKETTSSEGADPGKVEVRKTPSKQRVTKAKATPKNKATTKAKARGKKDTKVESENDGAVKKPTFEEEAFGNSSDDFSLPEAPEDEA